MVSVGIYEGLGVTFGERFCCEVWRKSFCENCGCWRCNGAVLGSVRVCDGRHGNGDGIQSDYGQLACVCDAYREYLAAFDGEPALGVPGDRWYCVCRVPHYARGNAYCAALIEALKFLKFWGMFCYRRHGVDGGFPLYAAAPLGVFL